MHWIEEDSKEQRKKIVEEVPSKTVEELKQHYQLLVENVTAIEAGQIPFPNYTSEETTSSSKDLHGSSKWMRMTNEWLLLRSVMRSCDASGGGSGERSSCDGESVGRVRKKLFTYVECE
ncbi:transcription factor SRM1-like [Arachis stenosperma]|uniref:transcription factor SRM1-like n=1 Tax=Arachis stenosperma TaxID=217475 RepID=UPI0025AC2E3D|nr:transcription factor SRM1-like [Arachis stenosperma]